MTVSSNQRSPHACHFCNSAPRPFLSTATILYFSTCRKVETTQAVRNLGLEQYTLPVIGKRDERDEKDERDVQTDRQANKEREREREIETRAMAHKTTLSINRENPKLSLRCPILKGYV